MNFDHVTPCPIIACFRFQRGLTGRRASKSNLERCFFACGTTVELRWCLLGKGSVRPQRLCSMESVDRDDQILWTSNIRISIWTGKCPYLGTGNGGQRLWLYCQLECPEHLFWRLLQLELCLRLAIQDGRILLSYHMWVFL